MKIHQNLVKKNDRPIGSVLDQYLRTNKRLSSGYTLKKIKIIWKDNMGPTIWSYTKSMYLNKNVLYINISSSPLRQELNMTKDRIIDLFNTKMGNNVITKIIVK